MLANFENSSEIKFTTISDVPHCDLDNHHLDTELEPSVLLSTTKKDNRKVVNTPVDDLPGMKDLVKSVRTSRNLRKIKKNQYQFVSIAWTILPILRFFLLCPEVV